MSKDEVIVLVVECGGKGGLVFNNCGDKVIWVNYDS